MHCFCYGTGNTTGVGIADAGFRGVRLVIFRQAGQVDIGDGKEVAQFLIREDVVDGTGQVRFFHFCLLSQAWADEDGLCFRMEGFDCTAAGDHRRYGTGNVGQQLMIELFDHGNPHGAAAARKLEIGFAGNLFVEFQGFLQGQNVSKDGYFQHACKAQALEGCTQSA